MPAPAEEVPTEFKAPSDVEIPFREFAEEALFELAVGGVFDPLATLCIRAVPVTKKLRTLSEASL